MRPPKSWCYTLHTMPPEEMEEGDTVQTAAEAEEEFVSLPDVISWRTSAHEKQDRTSDWYWALGIIGICGAVASVLWGNILFAVIIALAALSIGVLAARIPREHDVHIDSRGVIVDGDLYPYESLHSFWIAGGREVPRLYLSTTGIVHPHLVLGIREPAQVEEVYHYLSQFIEEEEKHSIGTLAAEWFGL